MEPISARAPQVKGSSISSTALPKVLPQCASKRLFTMTRVGRQGRRLVRLDGTCASDQFGSSNLFGKSQNCVYSRNIWLSSQVSDMFVWQWLNDHWRRLLHWSQASGDHVDLAKSLPQITSRDRDMATFVADNMPISIPTLHRCCAPPPPPMPDHSVEP